MRASYFETVDGARIFYTDDGTGPPAQLLHGWACDGNDWAWQLPVLTPHFRVLTVDHRGHGRSDAPPASYRAQQLADDAAALLRSIDAEQPVIVFGHSMGTVVASALAVRHPKLVRALCWSIRSITLRTLAWHRRRIAGTPPHVVAGCILGLYEGSDGLGRGAVARTYLAGRRVPTLAVHASHDSAEWERALSSTAIHTVEEIGAGHFLHQDGLPR